MTKRIKILFEDKDILAIEKPVGILVHPDERSDEETIYDIFAKKYKNIEIVHRLDKETSGVMLLAKSAKAHEFLKKQFSAPALELKTKSGLSDRQARIKKVYHVIVEGHFKNEKGVINKPIGRSPKDFRRWLAGRGARGELREAITEYKVLKQFTSPPTPHRKGEERKFSFVEIRPKTGRTHQIRVHMKYLSHPVVGDTLYNPEVPPPNLPLKRGGKRSRMFLHASSIEFKDLKGKSVKVESPLPKEFKKIVQ